MSKTNSAYDYLARLADESRGSVDMGFLTSYETIDSTTVDSDTVLRNAGLIYDNSLAAIAFIASGDKIRAKQIVDTFIFAQNHDRFYQDGRLRNGYRSGKINSRQESIPIPGWVAPETGQWVEDEFIVSTHTGDLAWVMLALLAYYETYGGKQYLAAAERIGIWIEANCRDNQGSGGYTGGLTGWENNLSRLTYKSGEHNLDVYAAFERLYLITGNPVWQERAKHAREFVLALWDEEESKFWIGTTPDKITILRNPVTLDSQTLAVLALRDGGKPYWGCLRYAEEYLRVGNGFDYNQDRDGVWNEGTAQMAVAYQIADEIDKANNLLAQLKSVQDSSGGIYAAARDGLTTGLGLPNGEQRYYFHRLYVGATAWMLFAEKGINPFWLGSDS
ncbi:MAG: hypothetical protein AB4426_18220 [Xenococcaceae cyanobacterium]